MRVQAQIHRGRLRGLAAALLLPLSLLASVDLHGVVETSGGAHWLEGAPAAACQHGPATHVERSPEATASCPACLLRSGVRGARLPGTANLEAPVVAPLSAPVSRLAPADSPRPLPLSRGPPQG